MLYDPLLIATLLLLIVTLGAAALYYGRIKRAREEYEKARDVVSDVVISFNRQVQRQEDRLGVVAYKTEVLSSKSEKIVAKLEGYNKQLASLASKVEGVLGTEARISEQMKTMDQKINDITATQEKIMQKIVKIEKREYKVPMMPEAKIEAAIPIKKERVLAPLTETELHMLELLTEGEKTAPEIKARIKLTREHTARLMKKLYEDGYLERNTQRIPYTYSIKEEMMSILKKAKVKT
ncbi:MAG: hypothetical protein AOA65_2358 [Candidatus Bathyarchaeota archaeon BA1]|nr:MAG: hypothetical protein AOA65_2358 [Candidatus Bathyarchaeota archaeon BA1]